MTKLVKVSSTFYTNIGQSPIIGIKLFEGSLTAVIIFVGGLREPSEHTLDNTAKLLNGESIIQ